MFMFILSNFNRKVEDIEMYVGALSETAVNGAIIGPTISCILAKQFKELKKGDRFYYENGPSEPAISLGKPY